MPISVILSSFQSASTNFCLVSFLFFCTPGRPTVLYIGRSLILPTGTLRSNIVNYDLLIFGNDCTCSLLWCSIVQAPIQVSLHHPAFYFNFNVLPWMYISHCLPGPCGAPCTPGPPRSWHIVVTKVARLPRSTTSSCVVSLWGLGSRIYLLSPHDIATTTIISAGWTSLWG